MLHWSQCFINSNRNVTKSLDASIFKQCIHKSMVSEAHFKVSREEKKGCETHRETA